MSIGFEEVLHLDAGTGEGGSEVVSVFDGHAYVTNGEEDRIDVFNTASGALVKSIDLTLIPGYDGVNSVSVAATGIAVAVEIADPNQPDVPQNGVVAIYDLDTAGDALPGALVEAGNLPDMVTYSKDGAYIFVANEGEPTDGGDPMGGLTVIDVATNTPMTFDFTEFDSQVDALRDAGVRIFPNKLPSTDFEPEYIAEGANGKLYVSLQEANALAIFDLASMSWDSIVPLGVKDHSVEGAGLDPNDKDDAIAIAPHPVVGLRMPDAIAATEIDGHTYVLTANEGDDRGDFDEGGDAARVGDILDGDVPGVSIDPDAYTPEQLEALERLNVSIIDGDTDGDGDIDQLHSYGARSFTIYDAAGNVVFDSGDEFEQIIARIRPANAFNNDDFPSDDPDVVDENRSDNKGPEPEAIAVGEIDGKVLAFIGLERDSGIMIYDITDPANSSFVDYIDGSQFGNISPEVITFVPAEDSDTGLPQIAVSYEVSGTTSFFDLEFGQIISGNNRDEMLDGTIGDDRISSRLGDDVVQAEGGDDFVNGGGGHDLLFGGAGNDRLSGNYGRDTLVGGIGDDELNGGVGADVFVFDLGDGDDRVLGFQAIDKIDLSATGLEFDDLTITHEGGRRYTVDYGDQGDSIQITMAENHAVLNQQDFIF